MELALEPGLLLVPRNSSLCTVYFFTISIMCCEVLPDKRMPLEKDPWSRLVQFDKTLKERSKINKTHKPFYCLAQLTRVELIVGMQ